jgi:hypothetical protein
VSRGVGRRRVPERRTSVSTRSGRVARQPNRCLPISGRDPHGAVFEPREPSASGRHARSRRAAAPGTRHAMGHRRRHAGRN